MTHPHTHISGTCFWPVNRQTENNLSYTKANRRNKQVDIERQTEIEKERESALVTAQESGHAVIDFECH